MARGDHRSRRGKIWLGTNGAKRKKITKKMRAEKRKIRLKAEAAKAALNPAPVQAPAQATPAV